MGHIAYDSISKSSITPTPTTSPNDYTGCLIDDVTEEDITKCVCSSKPPAPEIGL